MPKSRGKRMVKKSSGVKKVGIGAALAGAVAAAGAYYFYGPDGKKHRRQAKRWGIKAKKEVKYGVKKLKKIDKASYNALVDQVTKKYKKAKDISSKDVDKVTRELKKQWTAIEKGAKKNAAKGKRVAKKTAKTAQKTTKKLVKKATRKTSRKTVRKNTKPRKKMVKRKTKRKL